MLGHDLARLSLAERARLRRSRMGIVFQSFGLVASLTAGENVALPLALAGMDRAERRMRASEALGEVGLHGSEDRRTDELSGGERQRVGVARAIAGDPALVLADEPTGSLDDENAAVVLDLLTATARRRGASPGAGHARSRERRPRRPVDPHARRRISQRRRLMFLLRHALQLVLREPRRSVAAALGVGIAAALITSVLLFGIASGATVTRRALADLPVDAQVVLTPGADPAAAQSIVRSDPAMQDVLPFGLVHFNAATLQRAGSATQTSSGVIVGVDSGYSDKTGLFTTAQGTRVAGQVAVSRDLATNLGAVPGDTVRFALPGGGSTDLLVSGIADITGADLVLGPVDAAHRAAGANPPVDVAVIDRASLDAIAAKVPGGATAADPGVQGGGSSPVFAPELAVRQELQLRYDHTQLPGDPVSAQTWLTDVRHRIEGRGAGAFLVADDASASLEPIASDLVWGQILFIFLALPGVALALALSRLAADATADATRRHAALLRARGATRASSRSVFMGATALTAFAGAAAGALLGVLLAWVRFGPELSTSDPVGAILRALLIAIVASTILATAAAALPLRDQLRQEVALGRQELQRASSPLWQRLYLDVLAISAAAIVYLVIGSSIHPVIGAEGNPTVTIALTSFLAPLLLWTGGTLLLLRLSQRAMTRSGRLAGWLERILGPGGELAGRSLTARAGAASRAIVVLALSVSFATSVLIFDATYRQQQRVDAELTLGADLKIVPTQPTDAPAVAGLAGPGISTVTPFVDRIVYVGSEAQDLLAIDPNTLPQVSTLADTFFKGISGADAMAALRSQPDGHLVSAETAKDYSIVPGDRVRIRVPDVNGNLVQVDFHMVGIALEFPTAPKDAFLVGNQAFVASQTGNNRISFALARASGDPTDVARSLGSRLGSAWQVTDLGATNARLANSITSVDLADLVLLDLMFAVMIAAVGAALFLLAGLAERRRELATIEAIGAEPRQLRALVVGEATVIGLSGLLIGVLSGAVVGFTLLQIMAGLFDPPADLPTVPLAALLATALAVIVALGAAVFVADRALARLGVLALLRER